jgi:hypothetical protein
VARNKKIRVSDEELEKLKEYRDSEYDSSIPLGFVLGELVDERN